MTDYTELQARCQRGAPTHASANNLLAECYGALGKLIAENEALRDGANFRAIQSLRQDCEALRKDAERYRWLRDGERTDRETDLVTRQHGGMLDGSIDSAMGQGEHS